MGSELGILAATAATIGFVHTLTGPDHYLPFIVLGRARNWSLGRTLGVTALCGIGHVLGSVALGLVGIGLGLAVGQLNIIEGIRGDIASWLLISFGLIYAVWGLRKALARQAPHPCPRHSDGHAHTHHHSHHHEHSHVHDQERDPAQPDALGAVHHLRAGPLRTSDPHPDVSGGHQQLWAGCFW